MDAAKIDGLMGLSKSALEVGSYRDSYKYSSSILELDPLIKEAWIIKAASAAGLMASSEEVTLEELNFCLKNCSTGASNTDLKSTSAIIKSSYGSIISKLNIELKEKIIDHHKVPMPQGGSIVLHRLAQKVFARFAAKDQAKKRLKAIRLLEKSYELDQSASQLSYLIQEMDSFLSHSSEFGDYLNDEAEVKSYILRQRSILASIAQKSGLGVSTTPPKGKGSGCFIATAATGNYDDPKVITLRVFRDFILADHYFGRAFIGIYYKASPSIARWIEKSKVLKQIALFIIVIPSYKFAEQAIKKKASSK